MKKKANIVFFSSCFMIAVILEAYCMQVFNGDLFSVIGIGVVVLITGYLLIDSISMKISGENQKIIYFVEHTLSEEADKWNERYSSQFNIQKATYAATKKNSVMVTEQFNAILLRLEALEKSNAKSLQKIMELQKKSLEGQKKALNIEVNYGKDNTTQIIEFLKTQSEGLDKQEQLSVILDWLEKNNELLKENLTLQQNNTSNVKENNNKIHATQETEVRNDLLEEDRSEVDFDFSSAGNFDSADTNQGFDMDIEAEKSEIVDPEAVSDNISEKSVEIEPLYADPNKALTADEIASLFASFGN